MGVFLILLPLFPLQMYKQANDFLIKALLYIDAKRVHIEYVLLKKGSVNK
ncbi:hypothetical protein [Bacillus sp. B1-WWTP-T-0.5-Post-4]|nr:hypothetical protein [Bacillus sp. B1-WWTP-T-0.5-Post-4]